VDVALAAHGGGVAELGGDLLDRARHVALGGGFAIEALEFAERQRCQHRSRPGAEVLGRERLSRDLLQIGVDVRRIDRLPFAFLVDVLKEMLARDLLARAHDPRQPSVAQRDAVLPAALAAVFEDELRARKVDVAVAHGGKPVAAVLAGVFLIADPDERDLQKAHHGRQDLLAGQPAARLILGDACAKTWQRPAEGEHAVELGSVADHAPVGMVAVLFAASRIAPGRLKVAFAIGADPDLGPGRGYRQPLDAGKLRTIPDQAALGVAVAEGAAGAPSRDPRPGVGYVAQSHRARRRGGVRLVRGRCRRCLRSLHRSPSAPDADHQERVAAEQVPPPVGCLLGEPSAAAGVQKETRKGASLISSSPAPRRGSSFPGKAKNGYSRDWSCFSIVGISSPRRACRPPAGINAATPAARLNTLLENDS
jgi:hypothetical protein